MPPWAWGGRGPGPWDGLCHGPLQHSSSPALPGNDALRMLLFISDPRLRKHQMSGLGAARPDNNREGNKCSKGPHASFKGSPCIQVQVPHKLPATTCLCFTSPRACQTHGLCHETPVVIREASWSTLRVEQCQRWSRLPDKSGEKDSEHSEGLSLFHAFWEVGGAGSQGRENSGTLSTCVVSVDVSYRPQIQWLENGSKVTFGDQPESDPKTTQRWLSESCSSHFQADPQSHVWLTVIMFGIWGL